ncbi:MAG: NAD-dependent epimerase/dehydratase family protein [Bdellovibrionaceae bacterium]|nr:NAD-dependent epimerase/dehydratase family protein [Bdellovibrio sp.]
MKVLVTGANGFLGSWLTKRLLADGHEVTALVRKSSDLSELDFAKPNFFYGDISDVDSLKQSFKNQEIIFHLAGAVAYKKSDRPLMEKVNVEGTRNVVETCAQLQTTKLLHLSSVVAIGSSFKKEILNENSDYKIKNLNLGYFETKRKAEELVVAAAKAGRIYAVCVNPSTIYGAGDAKKGSRKTQVKVAQGKFPFYTNGGVNVVGVEDVVDGILLAVNKGRNGERYILSSENMTIKDLFQKIAKFAGVDAPKILMPDWALHTLGGAGDGLRRLGLKGGLSRENAYTASMYHWFDSAKAKKELGFMPKPANLAIENSVRWMKEHGYLE